MTSFWLEPAARAAGFRADAPSQVAGGGGPREASGRVGGPGHDRRHRCRTEAGTRVDGHAVPGDRALDQGPALGGAAGSGLAELPAALPGRPADLTGPVTPGPVLVSSMVCAGELPDALVRADLVATVAHELRSPLTSVKGFTATLLAKWGRFTDDQKKVMLETVNADADRVTRLITELLDVSRIESGRMEIHRQLVSVPERVEKIVAGRVAAGDPDDRYRVVIADGLPETWLDADKVDQILGNLIENAVRRGAGTVCCVVAAVSCAVR